MGRNSEHRVADGGALLGEGFRGYLVVLVVERFQIPDHFYPAVAAAVHAAVEDDEFLALVVAGVGVVQHDKPAPEGVVGVGGLVLVLEGRHAV